MTIPSDFVPLRFFVVRAKQDWGADLFLQFQNVVRVIIIVSALL